METGYLRIAAARKREKTILEESYSEGAFKITRPVYLTQGGEAYFYIMNPGGGYVDGDTYKIQISLEEGAEAVVTTQSSTKIYKTRSRPARQEMEIFLKKGSVLEYLPDPVIAYQHACFKQRVIVRMEKGATLICSDIFTPGWAPDGTLFQYDLLKSKMEVYLEDRLVLLDHVKLEPDDDFQGLGLMDGYTHFGMMTVIDHRVNKAFLEELHEVFEPLSGYRIGLSMLSISGFALRILANSTQEIESVIALCHETIRGRLLQKEPVFLRKY
nr:urease accessory protein UreD [Neobacillus sp. Marseille-Q6967]